MITAKSEISRQILYFTEEIELKRLTSSEQVRNFLGREPLFLNLRFARSVFTIFSSPVSSALNWTSMSLTANSRDIIHRRTQTTERVNWACTNHAFDTHIYIKLISTVILVGIIAALASESIKPKHLVGKIRYSREGIDIPTTNDLNSEF